VLGSEYLIKARKEDNLYIANPAENFFANKLHFYLLVQVPKDALDTVLENINTTAKLCAYSDMRKYLEYALPGISLKKLTAVPQGIPRISDCLYFQIDKSSQDWGRLEKEGSIAFYVGNITTELSISFAGTKD
jgi:type VI secretion system protein ImpJ